MEYKTANGHVVDDELLAQEAESFERGERPSGWRTSGNRPVNVTIPVWVIAEAEAERINVSRRAILNLWLAEKAEQSAQHRKALAMA